MHPENPLLEEGTLYVVATPIGNLQDLSPRAIGILASVDWVACEDTRHSRQLMHHFGINPKLISLHDHNEKERTPELISALMSGQKGALVSDAGTPLINDPGFVLVRAARQAGLRVTPIPGPSAMMAALSAAGLPSDRFAFWGFFPTKAKEQESTLQQLQNNPQTTIFYESPKRLDKTLAVLLQGLGAQRPAALVRELTKMYETWFNGNLGQIHQAWHADPHGEKGEYVLMIGPAQQSTALKANVENILRPLAKELPPKQAAKLAAQITGEKASDLYDQILRWKDQ